MTPTTLLLVGWVASAGAGSADSSWFEVRDQLTGLHFDHISGDEAQLTVLEQNGQGVCLVDYDYDGWLDLFIPNGSTESLHRNGQSPGPQLFRNEGSWRFEDRTVAAGIEIREWTTGCAAGDYDADGDFDLYVTAWGENKLLENDGQGRFTDATRRAGGGEKKWSSSASMADFNNDDHLDLYVSNYVVFGFDSVPRTEEDGSACLYRGIETGCGPWRWTGEADTLYLGDGEGGFHEATSNWGIDRLTAGFRGMGVVAADFNQDGWIDIYVGCDVMKNLHLENRGGTGFESIGEVSGGAVNRQGMHESGMGVAAVDYDEDVDLDLLTTNFADETNTFYRNVEDGILLDDTEAIGFGLHARELGWAVVARDFDHDGTLDVLVANGQIYPQVTQLRDPTDTYRQRPRLYRGLIDGQLEEVPTSEAFGRELQVSLRGAGVGHLDNDGDLDVVSIDHRQGLVVLENVGKATGYLVDVRRADGGLSPINSTLAIVTDRRRFLRFILPHQGYQSTHDARIHFALRRGEHWRSLEIQRFRGPTRIYAAAGQWLGGSNTRILVTSTP